jgi:serine/threonine protein kinase
MIDIWACGVLMYLIFSGNHPFKATNNFDLCKRILNDQVKFNGPEWKAVSSDAKSLIKGMLTKNPLKRLNLIELSDNSWIRKYCKPRTKPKFISTYSTKNLMLFNSERKLEQALQNYINNKISIDYAAGKLLNIFEEMD